MALDTKTNRLYLADAQFGPPHMISIPGSPANGQPHPLDPAILPGTFTILVVAPHKLCSESNCPCRVLLLLKLIGRCGPC